MSSINFIGLTFLTYSLKLTVHTLPNVKEIAKICNRLFCHKRKVKETPVVVIAMGIVPVT
jgi:hypothetical protein